MNIKLIILSAVCLLTAGGCSLHRLSDIEPPVEVPESYAASVPVIESVKPEERWWISFNDPTLNGLMDSMFSKNLDIRQAVARFEQLDALRKSSRSRRLPAVDARGSAARSQQANPYFGSMMGNSYSMSVSAAFELDIWQKLRNSHLAGTLESDAGFEDLQAVVLSMSSALADNYYLVIEQRNQLDLTDRTIESYRKNLELVEGRYRQGVVGPVDVYQARQSLAGAEAQRALYVIDLENAESSLAVLLGRYPSGGEFGGMVKLPEVPRAFPKGLPSELLTRRPDVRAALYRVMAADRKTGAAIADRFPSINLIGDYGRTDQNYSGGRKVTGDIWNIAGNLTAPLFDFGRRAAEVDRSRAVFDEALAGYGKTVLNAFKSVEDALVANRETEKRLKSLEQRADATESSLRLTQERYYQGVIDYLPVLTAQVYDFETQRQLLAARRQLISARISLARSLGGSWMENETGNILSSLAEEN